MHLSWSHYLLNHPSVADLDVSAEPIQTYFASNATPENKFSELCDNAALLLLTRSPVAGEVQASFHHTSRKDSFQQTDPFLHGIMGLGNKAYAVRTDPRLIFKRTHQRKVVPTMEQFLACTSIDDIKNITLDDTNTHVVWSSSVLPPYLYKNILSLDVWSAEPILLNLIQSIQNQRQTQPTNPTIPNPDDTTGTQLGTNNVVANVENANGAPTQPVNNPTADPAQIPPPPQQQQVQAPTQDQLETEAKLYYEPLKFLWAVAYEHDMLQGVPLPVCTRSKTNEWLDSLHTQHLSLHPTTTNKSSQQNHPNLASSLTQLANALVAKDLEKHDQSNNNSIDKEVKKFNRLPTANRNTQLLFQLQEGQDQEDVEMLEPTITYSPS